MATLTERFTTAVAFGFEGGPAYSTSIAVVPGGKEKRNVMMSNAIGKWTATRTNKDEVATQELSKYFHAAQGRANNFPFRDPEDHVVASGEGIVTLITAGSPGGQYQLYKRYTVGGVSQDRKIILPLNAVVAGGGSYSVSTTTGILTHNSGAAPTGWTGEFDCLCRFDTDELRIAVIDKRGSAFIYTWGDIAIKEDRL